MPTLPLLQTPPDLDGWHQVRAPGGYEGWYFDAEDLSAGIRLTGFLGEGCQFEGRYKSRYDRYRKRPTTQPPPTPLQYPAFEFALLKTGQPWSVCRSRNASPLQAATDRLAFRLAGNQLTGDGTRFQLQLAAEPFLHKSEGGDVTADLFFNPKTSGASGRFPTTPAVLAAHHTWSLAPFCDVTGAISIGNNAISFKGTGCLEHRYGTAPVTETIRAGVTGRLFTQERGLLFQALQPRDRNLETETRLVELTASGTSTISQYGKTNLPFLLPYPRRLSFDQQLSIDRPRRLHTTRILCYDARTTGLTAATCAELI